MGIEKYFTTSTKKKAEVPASKEKKDEEEFQEASTPKKKPKTTEEAKVDPKSFFSSKDTKAKPKSAEKKSDIELEETPIKATSSSKTAAEDTTTPRKKPVTSKTGTTKPAARKRRTIEMSDDDDEDNYKDNGNDSDDDVHDEYKEEEKPKKKAKTAEKTPAKKAATTKAAVAKAEETTETKETAPKSVKKEVEETEAPKKSNWFQRKPAEAPNALGTRPEPVGAKNCLQGKAFVITGQYETLMRDQIKDIVMRYGGRVTGSPSSKTDYLLAGRDAGQSKIEKAKTLKIKCLDEDEFYNLVESSAEQKLELAPLSKAKAAKGKAKETAEPTPTKTSSSAPSTTNNESKHLLWTERYKPQSITEIIGNKETVKSISHWLEHWQEFYKKGFAGKKEDMQCFRAILISGPPGIGKTTTAQVVAAANGYEALEFNASDARSKLILKASISEMMDNRTMTEFFKPDKSSHEKEEKLLQGKKVVLIMDEVDGMSGGDRGGAVELANLIRDSKIPVICICNDSRSTKVAPLLRVCYEAKYRRTPAAQIRARILSICFKEKLAITPNAVDELIASTQNDIRQVINILSTYRLKEGAMDYDQAKTVGKSNQKNSILGLFDIPGQLLSSTSWRQKTLNEKSDIYFHDYSLSNLMIFENYARYKPAKAVSPNGNRIEMECKEMDLLSEAAEAIADGDLVDAMIHGPVQHYSLMPVHSIFSCVRPASYMEGHCHERTGFPQWLGQNSKTGKYKRLLSDVQTRMRLKATGDKFEIRQNYIPTLIERIFGKLKEENFDEAMEYMDSYYLDRESLDTLSELTFSNNKDGPLSELPTKTKSAFTRLYNSKKHPILFQISGEPIKKALSEPKEDADGMVTADNEEGVFVEEAAEEEQDEESNPEKELSDSKFVKTSLKKRKAKASGSGPTKKKTKTK